MNCRLILSLLSVWLALPLAAAQPHDDDTLAPLVEQAENGDAHAARQLCMRYAVQGRTDEARAWDAKHNDILTKHAQAGDAQAMLRLATRYLTGEDYTPQSIEKAVTWYTRASEAGVPSAAYILGEIFAKQGNAPISAQSYKRAYELYTQQAAQKPDATALFWLGFMEQNGIGTERDTASGISKLEQAASLGSDWAASQLFKTYTSGIGVPRDEAKAYSYARQLADAQNHGEMAYVVATALIHGRGVAQDAALGEQYLDQAVRGNIPDAIYMKASRLEAAGRPKDALPFLRQAASMQQKDALVHYGRLLLSGAEGLEQDEPRGLAFLELAANRYASPLAAWELACYYKNIGESSLADSWYVTASSRGIAEAMARRGLLHLLPTPYVSWSPTEAYRWWRIGKQAGDPTCTLYVNIFLYIFTPLLLLLVFGIPAWIGHRSRLKQRLLQGEAPHS